MNRSTRIAGLTICVVAVFTTVVARAEICGLYQMEDFGDRILHSITDSKTTPTQPVHYRIGNPMNSSVSRLVRGLCYCVDGPVTPDPEFENDPTFRLIQIGNVTKGPFGGCDIP